MVLNVLSWSFVYICWSRYPGLFRLSLACWLAGWLAAGLAAKGGHECWDAHAIAGSCTNVQVVLPCTDKLFFLSIINFEISYRCPQTSSMGVNKKRARTAPLRQMEEGIVGCVIFLDTKNIFGKTNH